MGIVDKLVKKYNDENTIKFSERDLFASKVGWIPTNIPQLDASIGTFGLPLGAIVVYAGKTKSGKTTSALHAIKNFQKKYPDGLAVILSSENRDNLHYSNSIGIDTENVLIIKSIFLEELFYRFFIYLNDFIKDWKDRKLPGKPKVIAVWDSIGSTQSESEKATFDENVETAKKKLEGKSDKDPEKNAKIASFAKNGKACMKQVLALMYDVDMLFIAIAHTGDKISGMVKGGRSIYGGEWVSYMPSLIFETTVIENIKVGEEEVAQKTKFKIVKNDFGSRKSVIGELLFGQGWVLNEDDIQYAIDKKILEKVGAKKISFMKDKLKWTSKREFYELYNSGHKLLPLLYKKIEQERHRDVTESKKNKPVINNNEGNDDEEE